MGGTRRGFGDDEDCGCRGYGHQCDYHRQESERSTEEKRNRLINKGIDPDVQVTGDLVGLLFAISACRSLSENQKDEIKRIIFPYKKR